MSWNNYKDKVNRYFGFSKVELNNFIVTVLIFAFMFSFTQWGAVEFDAQEGVRNLIGAILIVGVSLFIHHGAQRLLGLWYGYRIEHRIWWTGLLIGLLALMLSNGRAVIFAASGMRAHFMPAHRLGAFRYGPSLRQIGAIAFSGPIAMVLVAFLLYAIAPSFFVNYLTFNLLFALYNMLPIPPLDGLQVFVGTRVSMGGIFAYTFTVSAFAGFVLVFFFGGFSFLVSLLLAFLTGLAGWFMFDSLLK